MSNVYPLASYLSTVSRLTWLSGPPRAPSTTPFLTASRSEGVAFGMMPNGGEVTTKLRNPDYCFLREVRQRRGPERCRSHIDVPIPKLGKSGPILIFFLLEPRGDG